MLSCLAPLASDEAKKLNMFPVGRACDKLKPLPKPLPVPQSLPVAAELPRVPGSLGSAAELRLVRLPVRADGTFVDWAADMRAAWDMSESAALAIMEQFLAEGVCFL